MSKFNSEILVFAKETKTLNYVFPPELIYQGYHRLLFPHLIPFVFRMSQNSMHVNICAHVNIFSILVLTCKYSNAFLYALLEFILRTDKELSILR